MYCYILYFILEVIKDTETIRKFLHALATVPVYRTFYVVQLLLSVLFKYKLQSSLPIPAFAFSVYYHWAIKIDFQYLTFLMYAVKQIIKTNERYGRNGFFSKQWKFAITINTNLTYY